MENKKRTDRSKQKRNNIHRRFFVAKYSIDFDRAFLEKSRKPSRYSLFPQLRGCICENGYSRHADYFDESEIYANTTQADYVETMYTIQSVG